MDAPHNGFSQAASDHLFDPELEAFILSLLELDNCPDLQFSGNGDLCNESNNLSSGSSVAASCPAGAAHAQSDCKLQSCVFNSSPSMVLTYTPPPSGQVVEFPGDKPASNIFIMPPHTPIVDVVAPVVMPSRTPPAEYAGSHQPPPASGPNFMYVRGNQTHESHYNFTFSFPPVEAKPHNHLLHDALHDGSKLTSPQHHHERNLQNSKKWGPPTVEYVHANPIALRRNSSNTSAAYMPSSSLSAVANSDAAAAMAISSASAPAADSSLYCTSVPLEGASLIVPPSPTPSVNKGGRARASSHGRSTVAFKVKTDCLTLSDGYMWKKYGEKKIIKHKFRRSYFKCNEEHRYGCTVLKRTQRCNDEDHVVFTYMGRHNHSP